MKTIRLILFLLVAFGLTACGQGTPRETSLTKDSLNDTSPHPPESLETYNSQISVDELCGKISSIKRLPVKEGAKSADPVYNQFLANSDEMIPCLVGKITDLTAMPDPRGIPISPGDGYVVGDTAFFMLFDLTGVQFDAASIFPKRYQKKWEEDGNYAYYEYVQDPKNRLKLQEWWRKKLRGTAAKK